MNDDDDDDDDDDGSILWVLSHWHTSDSFVYLSVFVVATVVFVVAQMEEKICRLPASLCTG